LSGCKGPLLRQQLQKEEEEALHGVFKRLRHNGQQLRMHEVCCHLQMYWVGYFAPSA
jgi:hypothetical protein